MIRTQLIDFKNSIPSTVVPNEDGSYTIFLNARLSFEKQREVFLHELEHIHNHDFEKYDADIIEEKTHKK